MSNKTQLQTNNSALDALITRVNAAKDTAASLPEAGSGGGSVETCTLELTTNTQLTYVNYSTMDSDGKIKWEQVSKVSNSISLTVICGTLVQVMSQMSTNMTLSKASSVSNTNTIKVFVIEANNGEVASATFTMR